jgi:hypothetical protein
LFILFGCFVKKWRILLKGYFKHLYHKEVVLFFVLILSLCSTIHANLSQIQLARVQYDGGGDWYNDPEVLPNLTEFIFRHLPIDINRRERVIKLTAPDLYAFPFLYLTGHGNIALTDQEIRNLRRYLLSGGFLYIDDDYGLDVAARNMIAKVFPEKTLTELPISHPIFSTFFKFPAGLPKIHEHDGKRPQLFAVHDDDGRIMILYTYESNISDGWADPHTHQNPPEIRETAFRFGLNIFYYLFVESD